MGKFTNLSGQIFGSWLVLSQSNSRNNNIYYLCRCNCGIERDVIAKNLKSGNSTSCGCIVKPYFKDLTGQIFSKWQVIRIESNRNGVIYYWCRCECGEERAVRGTHLSNNKTKSCGCMVTLTSEPKLSNARKVYKQTYADGDLLFEEFLELSQNPCFYCGASASNKSNRYSTPSRFGKSSSFVIENGDFIYNGLDRIDSNLPHNKNNIVSCCSTCNYSKTNMSVQDFKQWIIKVYQYFILNINTTKKI